MIEGDNIIEGTLRHIFLHNYKVIRPGGTEWSIKPRKPYKRRRTVSTKQYNRVVSFLRMVFSWKFPWCTDIISDKQMLQWLIGYIEDTYNDLYVYKQYENYEF